MRACCRKARSKSRSARSPSGQGHETTFAQVMADQLGVTPEEIKIVTGDTKIIVAGGGTHSDRSMRIAGKIMVEAAENVVEQARKAFAAMANVPENDVKFDDGLFSAPRSNLRLGIFDLARALQEDKSMPPDLRKPLRSESEVRWPPAGLSDRIGSV